MKAGDNRGTPRWQQYLWSGTGVGLLVTLLILMSLVGSVLTKLLDTVAERPNADLGFVFASAGVITQTLLRLLSILVGAAIAFAGLAVSFFAHEHATQIGGQAESGTSSAKATFATYSPGIFGIAFGAIIIVSALYAKGNHTYTGPQTYSVVLPTPDAAASAPEPPLGGPKRPRPLEELLSQPASAPK
jgi:hypothetical protein